MKKLLLLASILAMSGVAMAAANDGKSASDDLEVKAQIIKPLKITTSPVDFGIITAGQTMVSNVENGKIEINGENDGSVNLSVTGLDTIDPIYGVTGVTLNNTTNPSSKSTLIAALMSEDEEKGTKGVNLANMFNRSFSLDGNGELIFPVTGIIYNVPSDTDSGNYVGSVKITATYNFNPTAETK